MNEQAKALIQKYHILILPIASVLIGIAFLTLVIVPQALQIPETNKEIDQNKQTLFAINQKINDLNAIDLNQYQSNLNLALTALPLDQDIPGLFGQISRYLSIDGMNISNIGFANPVADNSVNSFKTQVNTTGTKSSLESFINRLNQVPRIMKISSLTTTGNANNDSQEISMSLVSFFQPAPGAQDIAADKPVPKLNGQNSQTLDQIKSFGQTDLTLFPPRPASGSGTPVGPPAGKDNPFQ
jgi:Tfp pilus assembly protein PilO